MRLTSFDFLLFAAGVIVLYYLIPPKMQWELLLAASYFFYACAGLRFMIFILFTTASVYLCALKIADRQKQCRIYIKEHQASLSRQQKKTYKNKVKFGSKIDLALCLTLNFLILAVCKACLINPVRTIVQAGNLSFLSAALPLGISFYLFQSAGYLIDVYREKAKAEKNAFRFALFVSFFPQLLQGPISKFNFLCATLFQPHTYETRRVTFGLQRVVWGYFKKLVVADRLAPAVAALRGPDYTGTAFFVLTVFYAIQLYCDFTGGIDIAIGLSQALGIVLPENFVRPYFSKNIAEYWRRWHITLGDWMKNYIFYPVSVSRSVLRLSGIHDNPENSKDICPFTLLRWRLSLSREFGTDLP